MYTLKVELRGGHGRRALGKLFPARLSPPFPGAAWQGDTPVTSSLCSRLSEGTIGLLFPPNGKEKDNLQM